MGYIAVARGSPRSSNQKTPIAHLQGLDSDSVACIRHVQHIAFIRDLQECSRRGFTLNPKTLAVRQAAGLMVSRHRSMGLHQICTSPAAATSLDLAFLCIHRRCVGWNLEQPCSTVLNMHEGRGSPGTG